jgi:hypothetical protein
VDGKTLLVRAVDVVAFVFAAFGGVLTNMAPPAEGRSQVIVGIASFLCLAALLFITAMAKDLPPRTYKRRWLTGAAICLVVALVATPVYLSSYAGRTFAYPTAASPEVYVRGTELTPAARAFLEDNPGLSPQQLVANFGGLPNRTQVWTEASLGTARLQLTVLYLALVLGLASGIFCIIEGILVKGDGSAEVSPEGSDPGRTSGG